MRKAFHEELDRITEELVEMTRLAGSAISRATTNPQGSCLSSSTTSRQTLISTPRSSTHSGKGG